MSILRVWGRRLKRLLICLLVAAPFVAGYCGWRGFHGQRQAQVVAALRAFGARVNYTHDKVHWARDYVAQDFYDDVETVDLRKTAAGAPQMELVCQLRDVETLRLNETSVRDADLAALDLPRLKTLSLWDTQIGDAGLTWLRNHAELRALGLSGTRVTDASLCELCRLPNLQRLHLARTDISDDGIVRFHGTKQIKFLDLAGTRLTDAGLVHLGTMHQLVVLWLDDTSISDAGISHLKSLSQLKWLRLTNTKVTLAGALDLQAALPQVGINF